MPLEAACTALFAWHVAAFELHSCGCASPKRLKTTYCTTPRLKVGVQGNVPTRSSSPSLCVVSEGVPRTDGRKVQLCLQTQTSCRLETGMEDCVAAVTAAVAACRRCKQRIKNINQLALVLGVASRGRCKSCPENTSSVAFETCVVQQ